MSERWYEFEQRETFTRPIYVKAPSQREARELLYSDAAVPDYSPNHPDMELGGRGRIAHEQGYCDDLAEERAGRS